MKFSKESPFLISVWGILSSLLVVICVAILIQTILGKIRSQEPTVMGVENTQEEVLKAGDSWDNLYD